MRATERGCRAGSALGAAVAVLCAAVPLAAGAAPDRAEPLTDWLAGLGRAADAVARGVPEEAVTAARAALRARPAGPAAARANAALGVALAAAGRPESAAAAFRAASPPPGTATELALLQADALLATGHPADAAKLLDVAAADRDLVSGRRARFRLGEALLRTGLAREGAAALERALAEAPEDPEAPRAILVRAAALRRIGDVDAAVASLRALWLDRADLRESDEAGDLLARWRAEGVPAPAPTGEVLAARAERLLWAGRAPEASDALTAAATAPPPAPAPARVALLHAQILLGRGDVDGAAQAVASLEGSTDPGARRGADWVLARVAARAGRVDEATARYARVGASDARIPGLSEFRQRDVGDEAAFLAAWLPYDAGQFAAAVPLLEAFARDRPRSRRADDARWFAAWSLHRLGRDAQAVRALARIGGRGELADAARYWRARLSPKRQQRKLYAAALASSDEGWYAVLSRARLAALGVRTTAGVRSDPRPIPEELDAGAAPRLDAAVALLALGLRDAALAELDALARGRGARAAAPAVAQLASWAEDAELPFRMARDHLLATRRTLRWGHPEAFPALVPPRAGAFGVDPSLVRAVMRRESNFRPAVRSGAGAEGLLQVVRPTAERLSTLLGVPDGLAARLSDPEVNVSLGAHYLGLLMSRFKDPAVAAAAYNAGPRPAAQWAADRAGMALDEWVESIPYRETRQYVKIVLSAWEVYRGLAGDDGRGVNPARKVPKPSPGVAF